MLLDGLAEHLADLGHGTYRPDAAYTDNEIGLIVGAYPLTPSRLVALSRGAGNESDTKLAYDEPQVRIMVRGTSNVRDSLDRAQAIYDDLHGAGILTLPDGTIVISITGTQGGPVALGRDEAGQHEHAVNTLVFYRNPTSHRPN